MALNDSAQKVLRWICFGLSIVSFVFAIVVVSHCSFMETDIPLSFVGGYDDDFFDDDDFFRRKLDHDNFDIGVGLFSFSVESDSCEEYEDDDVGEFGSAFKTARAFGVLSALATGFAVVLVVCIQLWLNGKRLKTGLWIVVRALFCVAFVCNTLTFTAFASDVCDDFDCAMGAASGIASANALFLLFLSILSFLVSPSDKAAMSCCCANEEEAAPSTGSAQPKEIKEEPPVAGESTKVMITQKADGTKVTTKEVTHPDGSKTITETSEMTDTGETSQ